MVDHTVSSRDLIGQGFRIKIYALLKLLGPSKSIIVLPSVTIKANHTSPLIKIELIGLELRTGIYAVFKLKTSREILKAYQAGNNQ